MFAIIKSGGRQVKVTPGSVVEVDRVPLAAGDKVNFEFYMVYMGADNLPQLTTLTLLAPEPKPQGAAASGNKP